MLGGLVTVGMLMGNTCFGEPELGMENGEPYVTDDSKSKVYGEPAISTENVLAAESTNANVTEDDLNDVKVCDICGDVGYEEVLVICSECNEGAEHIYCMQTLREAVPEGDWFCDDCKSKHMERDPRQPVAESQTPSSLTDDTMNEVINDSTDLKVSESGKSKLSSDKIEVQAQTSAVPSKHQIVDTNEAPENKKQATECVIVLVDESRSLLKSTSSSKLQETIRADNCGGVTETKISQRPLYIRDGPLKVSETGKSNSCATSLLTHNNSLPRSLSRDNSFKTSETAKVKFLPTHTVASLCSGTTLRGSTKSAGVDGNSDVISPRTGMMNSNQMSCRGNTIAVTDSTGHPANRSGHRSSFRQSSAYSSLQSAGLSKSGDAFPSFLLSSRNTNPSRVHSTLRNKKLIVSDNGLSEFAGNSTESVGTTRSTLKRSSHIIPISTKVEKSITDISASPSVLKLIGSTPELITVAKDNLHLALPSVEEKASAVVSEVIQPHILESEELKVSAKDKQNMEGFQMINKVVEDILTHYSNDMDSVREDSCWMKPMKGSVDVCDLPHNNNGNLLYTSALIEKDGLTTRLESTRMESSMDNRAVPNVLEGQIPKVDDSSLIKEPTMSTLSSKDNKGPDITILQDNFTSGVEGDMILSVSNKKSAACYLDKQPKEEPAQKYSKAPDPTILKDKFTSRLDVDTLLPVSNKKSVACYLDKQPNEDLAIKTSKIFSSKGEVSQISPPWVQKSQNSLAESNHGKNDSKSGVNLSSQLIDQGISDSSANTSNEANARPINEFCKDLFCKGGSLEKDTLPAASHDFVQADLVVMQSDKLMTYPPEKNISSFVVMPPKMLNPSARTNSPTYSSKNYDTRASLQGSLGSMQQKLGTWPKSDFLWRGCFQVNDRISGCQIYDGMQAHPSNKASQKVYEVSSKFPPQLLLEQVRRIDTWPIRFTESPPTDEDIALYIFPINTKSCQIRYSELLKTTVKQDLALRVYLDCAELLIFSSNQLPQSYHRYNGEMYLWGVFRRRKIPSADPEQPFPNNSNAGGRFAQVNPSDVLVNKILKPKQLYTKGHTEGEEDMDVDMEGGREIGTADGPTPRPESPIAVSIWNNPMGTVALSNSKPLFRHHKNYWSGGCMPSEQGGLSSVSTLSNSGKDSRKNPEEEEDMDVDMEGGREIGIAEIPTPRPQLANVAVNNSTQLFILPNSKPIFTQHENSRSGSCTPIENGGLSLVALWAGSEMNLGKVPEHMSKTDYVKDAEKTNNRPSADNTNNELDFPPGFEVQRSFYHSPVIMRNSSGMNIEAVPEKRNILGIHAKRQQRELPHASVLPKDNMYSSDRSLSCGFSLHSQNCPTSSMLDPEFPPGLEPPGMKPLVSPPEYPPGFKMASMKIQASSLDCPPGLEPTYMNPLVSNALCRPDIVSPPVKPLVSEVEYPPGLEAASVKPLASSPDCAPGLELACVKTLTSFPDCPPGLKSSVKPIASSSDCSPCLESAFGNHDLFSLHSCGTETASRVRVLSSSECVPGRETASGNSSKRSLDYPLGSASAAQKPLVTASDHPLENSALKQQLQDKSHSLLENKVELSSQRYTYLSPGKVDRSRNHSKLDDASGRRGVKRSYSFASFTREDEDRKAAKMSKSKSFKEELYNNRNSSRGKEDWRERNRRSNEKDYNRRRDSGREKDHRVEEGRREVSQKHGRENEGKEGSGKYSRDEEDKRKRDKRYREEEHAGDRYRGHHRYWNMLSESRRHKDHEKHSNSASRYRSPSESTTYSGSPSRGKYRIDAKQKMVFGHRANSSYSDSSIEHNCFKRSSLNKDSKNGGKAPMVCLHDEKAIMDMDSVQVPRSQPCSLENKDNGNMASGEILADYDDIRLCNQNDDAACSGGVPEENNLGATSQQAMEVNLSGKVSGEEDQILSGIVNDKIDHQVRVPDENNNRERASEEASGVNLSDKVSADHDHILLCDQNDDAACSHGVPEQNNLAATSQQALRVNLLGKVSADHDHTLLCNQNDDAACSHGIPGENILGENSQQAIEVNLSGKASGDTDQILSGIVNDKIALQLSVPDEKNNGKTTFQEASGVNLLGKVSADHDHILLCDLNNEATCDYGVQEEKNLGGAAFHVPIEVNVSDTINLRTCYVSLHSGQGEQHMIPSESNSCADSRLTIEDSVKCLQLFPIKGDCRVAETTTDQLDFNLQLGLEHWAPRKEPLPLLEQSSCKTRSLTFMFDNGASSSGSKSVCDDSREAGPPVGSILSLSMPRYRKQGNTWIEVNEESELSEEREADVKLSLSMF